MTARFTASKVARAKTIHVILHLQDVGPPPRCADRQAVATNRPWKKELALNGILRVSRFRVSGKAPALIAREGNRVQLGSVRRVPERDIPYVFERVGMRRFDCDVD